jgi:hypothetical protein
MGREVVIECGRDAGGMRNIVEELASYRQKERYQSSSFSPNVDK